MMIIYLENIYIRYFKNWLHNFTSLSIVVLHKLFLTLILFANSVVSFASPQRPAVVRFHTHDDISMLSPEDWETKPQLRVAVLGDSHVRRFYIGPGITMAREIIFSPADEANIVLSHRLDAKFTTLADRLFDYLGPIRITDVACPGARTDEGNSGFIADRILIRHLPKQVNEVLNFFDLPDVYLFWFAGNHLDWMYELKLKYSEQKFQDIVQQMRGDENIRSQYLKPLAEEYAHSYRENIMRLIQAAKNRSTRSAFVVFAMPLTASWKTTMDEIEEKTKAGQLVGYEYLPYSYHDYIRTENVEILRSHIVLMNDQLHVMADEIQKFIMNENLSEKIDFYVSEELSTVPITLETLDPKDGRHLTTPRAITDFSKAFFNGMLPALDFIGAKPVQFSLVR